jgi:deoxyhypusine synthase
MKGHNRIGNMIVPNDNYCRFEEWFQPIMVSDSYICTVVAMCMP